MQLDHVDLIWGHLRDPIGFFGCDLGHGTSDQINIGTAKSVREVTLHRNCTYLNGLVLEVMLSNEVFRYNHSGCGAVRCRTALQLGQRFVNHGRLHDLVQCVDIFELAVRIVRAVAMILLGNLREVLRLGAILVHVLSARVSKQMGSHWRLRLTSNLNVLSRQRLEWIRSVWEVLLQRARLHALETESQNAVRLVCSHCLRRKEKS